MGNTCMHAIIDKKFYLGPKFGILINKKWITISELLQKPKHLGCLGFCNIELFNLAFCNILHMENPRKFRTL
jgi:hypothetical protein